MSRQELAVPKAKPCPLCNKTPKVERHGWGWVAYCGDCYDGPDGAAACVSALGVCAAVDAWNEQIEEGESCG